ncbi:UNVERIFIED_CONTAM: E3 binding domain-containing protein [Campylobacter lari]
MKIKSTPIARAMAARLGIDLNQVKGTGIDGRILIQDIKNFKKPIETTSNVKSEVSAQAIKKTFISNEPYSQPISALRKAIAKNMTNS